MITDISTSDGFTTDGSFLFIIAIHHMKLSHNNYPMHACILALIIIIPSHDIHTIIDYTHMQNSEVIADISTSGGFTFGLFLVIITIYHNVMGLSHNNYPCMHACTHALTIIPSRDNYTHIFTTCMQLIIILSMHTCTLLSPYSYKHKYMMCISSCHYAKRLRITRS